jgi:hypothetical protein
LILAGMAVAADKKWTKEVESLEAGLDAKEWKRTADRAVKLRERMVEKVGEANELTDPIARTLAIQAIAEANLGRDDEALWHWHAAQSFLAGLESQDLTAYGRAGQILGGRAPRESPGNLGAPVSEEGKPRRYQEVKIRKAIEPLYPRSLGKAGLAGELRVRIDVGIDGRASRPEILDAGFVPTMAFPALEALRQWTFTPAVEGERPLPVLYELKILYR